MKVPAGLFLLLYLLVSTQSSYAQEENSSVAEAGCRYIDFRIKAIEKCNSRVKHQQEILIKRLKRHEAKLFKKLKKSNPSEYEALRKQPVSYDSILTISKSDSAKSDIRGNSSIDSLKGIQAFVKRQPESGNGSSQSFNGVEDKVNCRKQVDKLISQRSDKAEHIALASKNSSCLKGMQKQLYYSKEKMNFYKKLQDDPSKAEDAALEILQSSKGFNQSLKDATQSGASGMQALAASGAGAAQLEKMGYQTKNLVQGNLQQKFGGDLGGVTKQGGKDFQKWQKQQDKIAGMKATTSLTKGGKPAKPTFKPNPMRGLPFWKRLEKQYNWQMIRARPEDGQPALLDLSAMVGFKHTPALTYGVGIGNSYGLGQSWKNIHLTFQAIGFKTFASLKWQYGIAGYTGYERNYKMGFVGDNNQNNEVVPTIHNNKAYNETLLIGISKSYKINEKFNGAVQFLYDIWWQQKGLNNPFVLRFSTVTK